MADDLRQEQERILKLQRSAFTQSRPEPMSMRTDRIKRAMALIKENGEDLAKTMSADFGSRSMQQKRTCTCSLRYSSSGLVCGAVVFTLNGQPASRDIQKHWAFLCAKVADLAQSLNEVSVQWQQWRRCQPEEG